MEIVLYELFTFSILFIPLTLAYIGLVVLDVVDNWYELIP